MGAPSQSQTERFAPGLRIGSYVIEEALGSGGMGSVWAARHVGLDKPVAIKTLHSSLASKPEQVKRFVREGRAASRIRHPHVVDVTDVGTWEGLPYLVMEYLEGEDLHTRLDACGRLTPSEIARIMLPVLDALAFAHDAGVIHRDLKPSNIFLARGPHGEVPMLLDFGIAKILDTGTPDAQTITVAANYLGTPYYSSPEQAMSGKAANALSDQYSVGAIMYELASGGHGLPGETPFEVLSAIVAKQRSGISSIAPVDRDLAAVIERAMSHYPDGRYPSIRHLGNALLPFAPAEVRARWEAAFSVSDAAAGVGFAETMDGMDAVTGPPPAAEPSGPTRPPAFTPPGSVPVVSPPPPTPTGVPAVSAPAPSPTPQFSSVRPAPSQPSFEAAEPPEEARGGSGLKILFAAFAGLVVAGAAAGGLWYARGSLGVSTEREITFRATPDEARFALDGEALEGAGVARASLASDGRRHTLEVSAEGFETQTISFDAETPPEPITLVPSEPSEPTEQVGGGVVNEPSSVVDSPTDENGDEAEETREDAIEEATEEATEEDEEAIEEAPEDETPGGERPWWQRGDAPTPRRGASPRGQRSPGRPSQPRTYPRTPPSSPPPSTPRSGGVGANNAPIAY